MMRTEEENFDEIIRIIGRDATAMLDDSESNPT